MVYVAMWLRPPRGPGCLRGLGGASSLGDSADDVTHIPHAQEWGKRRKVKFKCRSMEFCLLLRHSVLDTKK